MTRRYPLVLVSGQPRELSDYDRIYNSGNVYRASSAPPTPVEGDLWCNTVNNTLQIYDGSAFVNVFASGNAVLPGDGIDVAGNTVSVDLKANSGLVIDASELSLDLSASAITGVLASANGGSGYSSYLNGELLIGNSATGGLTKATLTAGSNIAITEGNGSITIAATQNPVSAGDGIDVVSDVISVDLKANGGLVIESTELALDLGASSITGTLTPGDGGTGQTTYGDGELLIGTSAGGTLSKATLTAGSNVTITNGPGTITIAASSVPVVDGGNFANGSSIVTTSNTIDGGNFT